MSAVDGEIIEIESKDGDLFYIDLYKISGKKGGSEFYTVCQLKSILRLLDISTTGNKDRLVYNLRLYLYQEGYINTKPIEPAKTDQLKVYKPVPNQLSSGKTVKVSGEIYPTNLKSYKRDENIDQYFAKNRSLPECYLFIKNLESVKMPTIYQPTQTNIN